MTRKRPPLAWRQVVDLYLIPYREEYGDLLVPTDYVTADGYKLGQWVKEKRKKKRQGKLPHEQVRVLEDAGMVWSVIGLEHWKGAAQDFRYRYGHLDVPQYYVTDDDIPLGRHINGSRTGLRQGNLAPETKRFLDSLDPSWPATGRRLEPVICSVPGCTQAHSGRGWCKKHYNNWRDHGEPTPPMRYGMGDGHGVHGRISTGDEGGLICHECGEERQFLGRHARVHGLSADEYRQAHGLGRSTPLAAQDLREQWREKSAARVGSPEWERFEAARDPDAAREESQRALREPLREQALRSRREQALAASRSRPARECDVDGCGRKHLAGGLCRTHYYRKQRTGDVQADVPVRPRQGGPPTS